jgi:hypothetical protein
LYEGKFIMARTTFSGPVASQNGFITVSDNNKIISLEAPDSLAADYVLVLPPNDGTNGQQLTTDGAGVLSWTSAGGTGTVTSVGGTGSVNGLTLTGTVTSSGSLTLGGNFALTAETVANLESLTNTINNVDKYTGKMVVVLASGLIFTATGTAAADTWVASDGTTVATPV